MMRLKSKLLSLNANKTVKVKVYSPRNTEELRIPFKADKIAKVVGKLASIPPPKPMTDGDSATDGGPLVSGVLVQNDFKLSLMAPEDLREYAGLNTTTITCKQRLTLSAAGIDLIKWALEGTFGTVEELPEMRRAQEPEAGKVVEEGAEDDDDDDEYNPEEPAAEAADEEVAKLVAAYLIMGCVTVRYRTNGEVELEWEGNMLNDGIADSVMAVLFSVESSPAAVKKSSGKCGHSHGSTHSPKPEADNGGLPASNPHAHVSSQDRLERLLWFLEAQFGADNVSPVEEPRLPALPSPPRSDDNNNTDADAMDVADDAASKGETEEAARDRRSKELERLHRLGIPVPGVEVRVDGMAATVWLEDLEVVSGKALFADRVRAVVERAVEVTAPLWG